MNRLSGLHLLIALSCVCVLSAKSAIPLVQPVYEEELSTHLLEPLEYERELPKKGGLLYKIGGSEFKFDLKMRLPEVFYGKNLRLLNDANPTDRVFYFRHTLDMTGQYKYVEPKTSHEYVYVKVAIRNKGVWGDPESIASTTRLSINEFDTSFGEHSHGIPLHLLWIRELWVKFSLNDILSLPFCNNHTLTFGAFPFELGRGIALGTAYTIDASDLGFISEYAVDQYAFGGKLSGDIIKNHLVYDLYGAILDTKSASFDQVNAKIRGQQFFHRADQARGFGSMNYVVAARLQWRPHMRFEHATARIEPYILYNHNAEQRIEFRADAKSDLVTIGLATECDFDRFEWGFDTAFNFGNQTVFGWDRNIIKPENRRGTAVIVNSRVRQAAPNETPTLKSPLALNVPENQTIINQSPQTATQNSTVNDIKIIGINALGTLFNDRDRFANGYINKYRGSMFVFDMGYTIYKPELKVCAGFGYASGDANPNKDEEFRGDNEQDGEYDGFIGLQEVYGGTRIKSAFLLSGSGRVPRPLSFPSEEVRNPFPTSVSRFTNIVYVGTSAIYRPTWNCRKWSLNPNLLAYWTDYSTPFFDAKTIQNSVNRFARNFLGIELNLFLETELITDLKFYMISSLFFPGSHFKDIKGRPLNKAQQTFLDNLDLTGITNDRVPLLGNDPSYFFNAGLEYRF